MADDKYNKPCQWIAPTEQYTDMEMRVASEELENIMSQGRSITYEGLVKKQCRFIVGDVFEGILMYIEAYNTVQPKGRRYKYPQELSTHVVALIMKYCKDISMVRFDDCSEPEPALRIRDDTAPENGIWVSLKDDRYREKFNTMVVSVQPGASTHFISETYHSLCTQMSVKKEKHREAVFDGVHVPCQNGVYDRGSHTFMEWDDPAFDDVYAGKAFTFKLPVAYNSNAYNMTITVDNKGIAHEPWDVESFIRSLFDDNPKMCKLYIQAFWEIAAHVISGYSERIMWLWQNKEGIAAGSSGKSTALNALKSVCGETNVCTNSLNQLTDKQYGMADIEGKMAVLSDELEEGAGAIDNYGELKKLMRMEPVRYRNIYQKASTARKTMTLIQCCNQVPRFKGASESVFRCMRVLPFEKVFATDKGDRQYIRDDYVKRKEVSEYILRKCLEEVPVHYSEEVLEATSAKKSIMENSLPALQFMNEIVEEYPNIISFDVIPVPMLYDMFANWFEVTNHNKTNISAQTFWKQVQAWVGTQEDWEAVSGVKKITGRYKDDRINLDVFADFPANSYNRTWTTCCSNDAHNQLQFRPSMNEFRNGLRYTGEFCYWMDYSFLEKYVLPDKDGTWHQQYEDFCTLLKDKTTRKVPSYEEWVWDYHCMNAYDDKEKKFIRKDPDGVKGLHWKPSIRLDGSFCFDEYKCDAGCALNGLLNINSHK
ncbi:MAG: hypothetical protein HFG73_02535 [Hungatella sp.]|nr:hypothetical protein [Lachnospiraceae bacterium]MCI9147135.1 hypothetical protein [Hungatella sp.]